MLRLRIIIGLVCLTSLLLTGSILSVPPSDRPSQRADASPAATTPSCGSLLPKAESDFWACTFTE